MIRPLLLLALLAPAPLAARQHAPGVSDGAHRVAGSVKLLRQGDRQVELVLAVPGGDWTVRLGDPGRMARAGLTPAMLRVGAPLSVYGRPSAHPSRRTIAAERVKIGCIGFRLYPDVRA